METRYLKKTGDLSKIRICAFAAIPSGRHLGREELGHVFRSRYTQLLRDRLIKPEILVNTSLQRVSVQKKNRLAGP